MEITKLPDSLSGNINTRTFSGCYKNTYSSIPDEVTTLGQYAFASNTRVTTMTLPKKLKTIAANCFNGCTTLSSVYFQNTPTGSINSASFSACTALTDVYVPWGEGEIANAPWGATNATIHYNWTEEETDENS